MSVLRLFKVINYGGGGVTRNIGIIQAEMRQSLMDRGAGEDQ